MDIHILVVSNEQIRKREGFTCADWWFDANGDLQVRIAKEIRDNKEIFLLSIHEAIEACLCKFKGITVAEVDKFDKSYQRKNEIDLNGGDEVDAPYHFQHTIATAVERILAGYLRVFWKPYDDKLSKL